MIVYADSSLLVKRYLVEAGSEQVSALLAPPVTVGTSLIARAEVAAALAKAARLGLLTRNEASQSLAQFRQHWPYLLRLSVNEAVVKQADDLAWEHNLRGYDAVHLATAAVWQFTLSEPLTLGTYDHQLWQAGRAMGLAVWPAGLA